MKELFKNKKLIIGIAIGLVLIIGVVLYFGLRKAANKSDSSTGTNPFSAKTNSTPNNVTTKQVADTSGGTISANSAASKGTLFV